jgi:hypothetical protein
MVAAVLQVSLKDMQESLLSEIYSEILKTGYNHIYLSFIPLNFTNKLLDVSLDGYKCKNEISRYLCNLSPAKLNLV